LSSTNDGENGRISRRRFLELAGALVAAGVVATNLGRTTDALRALGSPIAVRSVADQRAAVGSKVPANSFSIFWITDTQFLSESNPALFKKMTSWIADNWGQYNGKLVIHTGDVVQTGANQDEWANADEAMAVLHENGIPYSWCAGNHDDMVQDDQTSGWKGHLWSTAFNPSAIKDKVNRLKGVHWVGHYHDGMNTAVTFRAEGLDFLVVNLEWKGDSSALEWARGILDDPAYKDHYVIVAPHAYIDAFGSLADPRWSDELSDFIGGLTPILDSHSSNVFLTLNGHFATDCGYNTKALVHGRNQLMFDRQDSLDKPTSRTGRGVDESDSKTPDSEKVGGATVTILTLVPSRNTIWVKTYDTYTEKWREGPYEQYSMAMLPALPRHSLPAPVTLSVS
jgi:hypothetical protein